MGSLCECLSTFILDRSHLFFMVERARHFNRWSRTLNKCTGKIIDNSFIDMWSPQLSEIESIERQQYTRHVSLDERSKRKPGFHHLYKVLTYVQCIIGRHTVTVERWRSRNSYITRDQNYDKSLCDQNCIY
jgi:hypothetical protein